MGGGRSAALTRPALGILGWSLLRRGVNMGRTELKDKAPTADKRIGSDNADSPVMKVSSPWVSLRERAGRRAFHHPIIIRSNKDRRSDRPVHSPDPPQHVRDLPHRRPSAHGLEDHGQQRLVGLAPPRPPGPQPAGPRPPAPPPPPLPPPLPPPPPHTPHLPAPNIP